METGAGLLAVDTTGALDAESPPEALDEGGPPAALEAGDPPAALYAGGPLLDTPFDTAGGLLTGADTDMTGVEEEEPKGLTDTEGLLVDSTSGDVLIAEDAVEGLLTDDRTDCLLDAAGIGDGLLEAAGDLVAGTVTGVATGVIGE